MKCNYCGGNLSLETEVCPYCGRPNEQAQKHVRAMKSYRSAFERTKRGVEDSTQRYTGATIRVVMIAVLFIVIIAAFLIGGNAYEFRHMWIQNRAEKNASEYMEIMDRYLEEENFLAFNAFCNENYIYAYDNAYEKYAPVERVSQIYCYVYTDIMKVACPPEYQDMESILESLVESLDYFYGSLNMEDYLYYEGADNEQNRQALQTMEQNVTLMLQTYCGLSKEDAEDFKEQTKARRAVMLEEAVNDGK